MSRIALSTVLIFAAFASSSALAGSNLLKDGSFEQPRVGRGADQKFKHGQNIGPWTVTQGTVAVVNTDYEKGGFQFGARNSTQWLNLAGGVIEQTVSVSPGEEYKLTFYVGSVYDPKGKFGRKSTVLVNFSPGGTERITFEAKDKKQQTQQWKQPTYILYYPKNESLTIQLKCGEKDADCGLDQIDFRPG